MAQPDLVSTEKDAVSSTEDSLDFSRDSASPHRSLSVLRACFTRRAAVTPLLRAPSQRLEQGPGARWNEGPLATAACTASPTAACIVPCDVLLQE